MSLSRPVDARPWPGPVPQRRLAVGEILGLSTRLAWLNASVLLPVAVVATLLSSGAVLLGLWASGDLRGYLDGSLLAEIQRRTDQGLAVSSSALVPFVAPVLVTLLVSLALGPLMAAVATPLAAYLTQHPAGARAGLARLRGRLPVVLGCVGITAIGVLAGLVAFVVPGLILWLALQPVGSVAAMEGLGVRASLARTAQLTAGLRWRIAGVLLLVDVISAATGYVLNRLVSDLFGGGDPVAGYVLTQVIAAVPSGLVLSWTAMAGALLYIDLRMRKDDLATRLGRRPASVQ